MKIPSRTPDDKSERTSDAAPNSDGTGQDAVALLTSDHRKVEELFKQYESATSSSKKTSTATEICRELIVHTMLEEELFYQACREKGVEDDALDEAQVEHDSAKVLIAELMSEKPGDAYFDAKVKVLSEYIRLHVGEEENPSDGIFAKARSAGVDMDALGEKIQARKSQLLGQGEFGPPNTRSLHVRTARTNSQENQAMPRYSQDLDRDDRGRFMSNNDHRGGNGSRYRDDDDYRRGWNDDRPRNGSGQFMRDNGDDFRGRDNGNDFRGRGNGDDFRGSRSDRFGNDRDRDENGRFMSHDERGGMHSTRSRYDDDYRGGESSFRRRDEEGRFVGGHDGRDMADDRDGRSRYSRSRDDDDRNGGRGWYGDPRGHSEASHRGWEHREGRYAADDDDRRGYASRRRYEEDDDNRGSHGGWFGDHEGHSEAARRGWRNR